jgi:hypothetical protein
LTVYERCTEGEFQRPEWSEAGMNGTGVNRVNGEVLSVASVSFVANGSSQASAVSASFDDVIGASVEVLKDKVLGLLQLVCEMVEQFRPIRKLQLLRSMKLLEIPLRLTINSHARKLTGGVSRLILLGANQERVQQSRRRLRSYSTLLSLCSPVQNGRRAT